MPRFQKRVSCDVGYPDGKIPFALTDMIATTGTLTTGYSASGANAGLYGTSTSALVIQIPLASLVYKSGAQDDLQEQFGGGTTTLIGAQGLAAPPNSFTTPAGVSGPPPFTGVTQLTPVTAARPKGIQVNSITFNYSIITNAATVNQVQVLEFDYSNGVAPVVTTLLANGTNGMQTAAATNPYSTTVNITTPAYLTNQNKQVIVQWSLTPGAGGANIYGITANVTYNFN